MLADPSGSLLQLTTRSLLKELATKSDGTEVGECWSNFKIGNAVRIDDRSFADHVGKLEHINVTRPVLREKFM